MTKIGLFFLLQDEILGVTYEKCEGIHKGGFIIPHEGHERVWRRDYSEKYKENYDFYPRGRVVYNTNSKQFVIYYDKCINEEQLDSVKGFFGLEDQQVRYTIDEYYSCQICSQALEDDWF